MRGKRTVGISLLSCSRIPFACIELTHADTRLCLTHRFVGTNALATARLGKFTLGESSGASMLVAVKVLATA